MPEDSVDDVTEADDVEEATELPEALEAPLLSKYHNHFLKNQSLKFFSI